MHTYLHMGMCSSHPPAASWCSLMLPGDPWCSLALSGAPRCSLVLPVKYAPWCSLSNMHDHVIMHTLCILTYIWECAPWCSALPPWWSLALPCASWCSLVHPVTPWCSLVLPSAPWCYVDAYHTYHTYLPYGMSNMHKCTLCL
jgi:hypothetical protein